MNKRYLFPLLVAVSAISVSVSAAFYSVSGLSKLFAGAATAVIIMTGSLEAAKLISASFLYRYWTTMPKLLRNYLATATVVLMLITSIGIYGFLSSAYQKTYSELSVLDTRLEYLEQKEQFFQADVARYDLELERISNTIGDLSRARATSYQVRDGEQLRTAVSTAELQAAQSRIQVEERNRAAVQQQRSVAADSLQNIRINKLTLEANTETAAELGPLRYLSNVTGWSMDSVVNFLLLLLIFVFDPLAVSLVIAANFAFMQMRKPEIEKTPETVEEKENIKKEEPIVEIEEPVIEKEIPSSPLSKIERILQKTPSFLHVLLPDGRRKKILKSKYHPDTKEIEN